MNFLLKYWCESLAGLGIVFWYLAASTSDYHVTGAGEEPCQAIGRLLIIGGVLMLPMVIRAVNEYIERKNRF